MWTQVWWQHFFLSWIKNFTLDCTSYYDKLFTYSDINFFFFKAATDTMYFIFSNNTQTIIAMGLGTCQGGGKRLLCRKLYQAASNWKTTAPVTEEPNTVLLERQLEKAKVPKTTVSVASNDIMYTSEQQLASSSSMSVNCAD